MEGFNISSLIGDPKALELISKIQEFFKGNGLEFNQVALESMGKQKFLKVTLSIKLN